MISASNFPNARYRSRSSARNRSATALSCFSPFAVALTGLIVAIHLASNVASVRRFDLPCPSPRRSDGNLGISEQSPPPRKASAADGASTSAESTARTTARIPTLTDCVVFGTSDAAVWV